MNAKPFPSLKAIATESWQIVSSRFLSLFGLTFGGGLLVMTILGIGFVATAIAAGVSLDPQLFQQAGNDNPQAVGQIFQALASAWPALFFGFGLTIIVVGIISLVMQVALIKLLGEEKTLSLGEALKASWPLILPYFVVTLLVSLLTTGSFFVFFLPAIVVSLLLMFARYDLILEKSGIVNSLKRSAKIVTTHLGNIILYFLAYIGAYLVLIMLIPNLLARIDPAVGMVVMIIRMFVNILASLFGAAFGLTLYRKAKDHTDFTTPGNISWMVVVAIIGYMILFGLVGLGIKAAKLALQQNQTQNDPYQQTSTPSGSPVLEY